MDRREVHFGYAAKAISLLCVMGSVVRRSGREEHIVGFEVEVMGYSIRFVRIRMGVEIDGGS